MSPQQRPILPRMILLALLLLILPTSWPSSSSSVGLVRASKDDSYYGHGVNNPNVEKYPLYWKEPRNVLQDLDQFSSVYIVFHSCFWSEVTNQENNNNGGGDDDSSEWYLGNMPDFPTSESHWGFLGLLARVSSTLHELFRAYFRSNEQNNGGTNGNNDYDNGGNSINHNLESDEWYFDSTPTFGANAAYSLYGVLKDDRINSGRRRRRRASSSSSSFCTADTYINTFVTTGGVDALIAALGAAGVPSFEAEEDGGVSEAYGENFSKFTSTCTPKYDNQNGQHDYDMAAEDASSAYVYRYSEGSTSYGLACSGTDFVLASFDGDKCDAAQQTGVMSSLDTFQEALSSMSTDGSSSCVQLYNGYDGGGSITEDGMTDDGGAGVYGDEVGDSAVSLLLEASTSCPYSSSSSSSSYQSEHQISMCPDPHGKLRVYTQALEYATSSINTKDNDARRMRRWSLALIFTGLVMACTAIVALRRHHHSLSSQEHAGTASARNNDKGSGGGSLHDADEYEIYFTDDDTVGNSTRSIVVEPGHSVCNSLDVSLCGTDYHEPTYDANNTDTANPLSIAVEFVHTISDLVLANLDNMSKTPTISNISFLSGHNNREDERGDKKKKKLRATLKGWITRVFGRKQRHSNNDTE